jgi:hypothetical protein
VRCYHRGVDAEIGVSLGPPTRARSRARIDPVDPDRLFIEVPGPVGARVIGAVLLGFATFGSPDALRGKGSWAGGVFAALVVLLGAALSFYRRRLILDRLAGHVIQELGLPWTVRRSVIRSPVQAVELSEESRSSGESPETRFPVALRTKAETLFIEAPGVWEAAADVAESAAHFLRVPLRDGVRLETLGFEDLDRSVAEAVWREGAVPDPTPPDSPRSRVEERPGGLLVHIPTPGEKVIGPLLGIALLTLIFWTLPVGLVGSVAFGLLPLVVVLASALKAGFGYAADLDVSPQRLVIRTRGLVVRRRVEIPSQELEDLIFLRPEWGGPRNVLAFMMDGFLSARSDRASVRFGHGLDRAELLWLQARILRVLTERVPARFRTAAGRAAPSRGPRGRTLLPADRITDTLIGLVLGGIAGDALGGALGVSVRLPFLEHVLNVGGLVGAVLARLASVEWRRVCSPSPPARHALAGLAAIAVLALALAPGSPLVQRGTSFDEARMLSAPTAPGLRPALRLVAGRPWAFWVGWSATLSAAGCVGAWAAGWVALRRWSQSLPRNERRRPQPPLADAGSGARRLVLLLLAVASVGLGIRHDRAGPGDDLFGRARTALRPRAAPRIGVVPTAEARSRVESQRENPVVLFFAAYSERDSWLLPGLARLARGYPGDLDVVCAPLDVAGDELRDLVRRFGGGLLHAEGQAENAAWADAARSLSPSGAQLIDASGAAVWGGKPGNRLDEAVAALLGPPRASSRPPGRDVPGQLEHAGEPFPVRLPQPMVKLQVYDTWSWRRVISEADLERTKADVVSGAVTLRGLPPGAYSVSAAVWSYDGTWDDPFSGGAEFGVPETGAIEPVRIPLVRKLRLREPIDTGVRLAEVPALPRGGRVRFAWDLAPPADRYRWVLHRLDATGKERPEQQGSTTAGSLELDLVSGPCALELSAWRGDEAVGRLQVRVANSVSGRLQLRVP